MLVSPWNRAGEGHVNRAYALECTSCFRQLVDDGLILDCPGEHAPPRRLYPWESEFDAARCTHREMPDADTLPVDSLGLA